MQIIFKEILIAIAVSALFIALITLAIELAKQETV